MQILNVLKSILKKVKKALLELPTLLIEKGRWAWELWVSTLPPV